MKFFCTRCAATCENQVTYCLACGSFEPYLPEVLVRNPLLRRRSPEFQTARQLAATDEPVRVLPFLGGVPASEPIVVAVWGPPGAGKSTLLLQLADATCRFGRVLYSSPEEGTGASFRDKLRRFEIRRDELVVCGRCYAGDVLDFLREAPFGWFFLDSYSESRWNTADLAALESKGVSVVYSLHATKSDQAAGALALLHGADVVLHVEGGAWETEKNRFGGAGRGDLWQR